VRVLEGDLAGTDGPASVFVDIIGMPPTPLSFAGVARPRRDEPTGMGPLARHATDPMDTQVITRRPTLPTLTHTEVAEVLLA
jgi:hypothetical protein